MGACMDNFDLLMCKVFWGSFGALAIFAKIQFYIAVSSKPMILSKRNVLYLFLNCDNHYKVMSCNIEWHLKCQKFENWKTHWHLTLWSMGKWKLVNILEMANGRAKRSEIWDSGVIVEHVWGTFDRAAFKVIWGSFVALGIFWKKKRFSKRCCLCI